MLNTFVKTSREWLQEYPEAQAVRTYLNTRISSEAQELWNFGYFPTSDQHNLLFSSFSHQQLEEEGLIYYYFDYNTESTETVLSLANHNLIIPYYDLYGRVIALVGRTILTEIERQAQNISKYKNTIFNKNHHLFGLWQAKEEIIKRNQAIVVEGQFDCIHAHMAGLKNVVAVGGSGMSMEQISLLLRFTENVVLMFDQDEAGKSGMDKVKTKWENRCHLKILELPAGFKDLDEFVGNGGEAVQNWIEMTGN